MDTIEHRELCSMICGSLGRRGVGGNGYMRMYGCVPFAIHLKLSQHYLLISYTQYQFKSFKKIKQGKKHE